MVSWWGYHWVLSSKLQTCDGAWSFVPFHALPTNYRSAIFLKTFKYWYATLLAEYEHKQPRCCSNLKQTGKSESNWNSYMYFPWGRNDRNSIFLSVFSGFTVCARFPWNSVASSISFWTKRCSLVFLKCRPRFEDSVECLQSRAGRHKCLVFCSLCTYQC